jgi:DNA polymerase III subunit gamma/tau
MRELHEDLGGPTSLDVIEIDAASNRGVDDARDLRERAMYAPTDEHRYKIYIIDEAHMLTREAWNALLKILEEPPPRVIFVFATTEPQKIQQTPRPHPVPLPALRFPPHHHAGHRRAPAVRCWQGEGIEADDDALTPIARRAEGGMRDALSLMDQVLSFAEGRVTGEDVRRVLGLVGEQLYLELFDIIADRRYADVFRFVQRIIDEGYDLTEFYRGLADALRALMVTKLEGADRRRRAGGPARRVRRRRRTFRSRRPAAHAVHGGRTRHGGQVPQERQPPHHARGAAAALGVPGADRRTRDAAPRRGR